MNLSVWLIRKLKRRPVNYSMCSRKKKHLYDVLSVPYMIIDYLTIIGFFYNLLYGVAWVIGWLLDTFSITSAVRIFLFGWPGVIINTLFPIMILGFLFTLWLDVLVGDPTFFKITFKYRVLKI